MNEQHSKVKKACRTIFPMGFGVRKVDDGVIILEFIDLAFNETDNLEVIASIAITEKKVKHLIESLKEAIDGGNDDWDSK